MTEGKEKHHWQVSYSEGNETMLSKDAKH